MEPADDEEVEFLFPVEVIPRRDYERTEVKEAMAKELDKFKVFEAYDEVDNDGPNCIPIRWVVTKQPENGKGQPVKARLCMRGDLEKGKNLVRSDSPTASKDTLKLALLTAANEGFSVKSVDIKSAY